MGSVQRAVVGAGQGRRCHKRSFAYSRSVNRQTYYLRLVPQSVRSPLRRARARSARACGGQSEAPSRHPPGLRPTAAGIRADAALSGAITAWRSRSSAAVEVGPTAMTVDRTHAGRCASSSCPGLIDIAWTSVVGAVDRPENLTVLRTGELVIRSPPTVWLRPVAGAVRLLQVVHAQCELRDPAEPSAGCALRSPRWTWR